MEGLGWGGEGCGRVRTEFMTGIVVTVSVFESSQFCHSEPFCPYCQRSRTPPTSGATTSKRWGSGCGRREPQSAGVEQVVAQASWSPALGTDAAGHRAATSISAIAGQHDAQGSLFE